MAAQQQIPLSMREFTRLAQSAENINTIGLKVFMCFFVLGALMMLISVFLPRENTTEVLVSTRVKRLRFLSRVRKALLHLGLIILGACSFAVHQVALDQKRGFIADQDRRYEATMKRIAEKGGKEEVDKAQYLYLPQGNSLTYMTLGNTSIAADYLWLTSLQYVSNSFRRGQKFELLKKFYDIMMDLDPHWIEGECNAGKVLSALQSDRYAVEKYYVRTCIANPDNWRMRYEAGMLFVVPPMNPALSKDYAARAMRWFQDSKRLLSKIKDQTTAVVNQAKYIDDLIGKLALESDYYETADEVLWKQAHDTSIQEALRVNAAREWLSARSLLMAGRIQRGIDEYTRKHGAYPPELAAVFKELAGDKLIHDIDAFGFKWDYDSKEGKVSSRGVKARRTLMASGVMNSILGLYRGENGGKTPRDLIELQQFVWKRFPEPPPSITDVLGADLNVITNPLGSKWDYDSILGKVNLPPICTVDVLFQNADKILNSQQQ